MCTMYRYPDRVGYISAYVGNLKLGLIKYSIQITLFSLCDQGLTDSFFWFQDNLFHKHCDIEMIKKLRSPDQNLLFFRAMPPKQKGNQLQKRICR